MQFYHGFNDDKRKYQRKVSWPQFGSRVDVFHSVSSDYLCFARGNHFITSPVIFMVYVWFQLN